MTNLSLSVNSTKDLTSEDTFQAKIWGFGGDGSVSSSKSIIKIISEEVDYNVQGTFYYDSRKQNGITTSNLRFEVPQFVPLMLFSKQILSELQCLGILEKLIY